MGFIYLILGPDGKGYVGQTNQSIRYRWNQHVSGAFTHKESTKHKLGIAIREHGVSAFKLIECWSCEEEELNEWEVFFVELFETFGPDGYNGTPGGGHVKKPRGPKKKYQDWLLPKGITLLTSKSTEGFRVRINRVDAEVITAEKTMDEKLEEALLIWEDAQKGSYVRRERARPRATNFSSLPRYVYADPKRDRVWVQKQKHPKKYFQDKSKSIAERIAQAAEYAAELA